MAIYFETVSTYLVFAYGGPGGNAGADATISLGLPNAYAFLRFYPDGTALPANSKSIHVNGTPMYTVTYRSSRLPHIVDLLRNETPIRFFFRDDNLAAYITTADEPVGEGEG